MTKNYHNQWKTDFNADAVFYRLLGIVRHHIDEMRVHIDRNRNIGQNDDKPSTMSSMSQK